MSTDTGTLKDALAQFGKVVQPLVAVTKVKASAPDALESLEAALKRLSSGETFGQALEEARGSIERAVEETRRERVLAFKRIEADFVRAAQHARKSLREQNDGWRIGMLELQFKRKHAQARARYNHEVVVDWMAIGRREDLDKLETEAEGKLAAAAFPDEMLTAVFWDAYAQERQRRTMEGKARAEQIPILDFYREVRATLVRHELAGQKPDKRLQHVDLPRWRFLYNLDRYRAIVLGLPEGQRLGLQTGSQQEVARGLGLSVNGLDATLDYKTMCYVIAPSRAMS